jgi:hypothetical protein
MIGERNAFQRRREAPENVNLWSPLRKTRVKPEFGTPGAYIAVAFCRVSIHFDAVHAVRTC